MENNFNETLSRYEQSLSKITLGEYFEADDLLDIIDYYIKNERYADADQCLGFALAQYPDNEDVWITKAYRLKSEGRWDEARAIIDNLSDQECADARLFRIEEQLAAGNWRKAIQAAKKIENEKTLANRFELFIDISEIFIDYGLYEEAIELLLLIPKGHPEKPRALELIAECHFQKHEYGKAAEASNKLIDLDPYNSRSWEQLANIRHMQDKYQEMRECAEYALAINPNSELAARQHILAVLCNEEKVDEIFPEAEKYTRLHPEDIAVNIHYAQELANYGQAEKSIKVLQECLKHCPFDSPDYTRLLLLLCYAYSICGKKASALETITHINSLEGDLTEYCTPIIYSLAAKDCKDMALLILMHMNTLMPMTPSLLSLTVHFLAANKIYEDGAILWHRCLMSKDSIVFSALPGLARAAFEIVKNVDVFEYYLFPAIYTVPEETIKMFEDVVDCSEPEQLIFALKEIADTWENAD